MLAFRAPVDMLPLVACVPLQPADATHEVALVVLHVNVEAPPAATMAGTACSTTVGVSSVGGEPMAMTGASADEQAASTRLAANSAPIARLAERRHAGTRPGRAIHLFICILSFIS